MSIFRCALCPSMLGVMFERIVVAFDGSAGAREALRVAVELAGQNDATRLVAVAVEAHLPHYAATGTSAAAALARRVWP